MARGRIPGVYTDWGKAERQVNGFLGAIHKTFRDRKRAKRFVRDNLQPDEESEDSEEAPSKSKPEDQLEEDGQG